MSNKKKKSIKVKLSGNKLHFFPYILIFLIITVISFLIFNRNQRSYNSSIPATSSNITNTQYNNSPMITPIAYEFLNTKFPELSVIDNIVKLKGDHAEDFTIYINPPGRGYDSSANINETEIDINNIKYKKLIIFNPENKKVDIILSSLDNSYSNNIEIIANIDKEDISLEYGYKIIKALKEQKSIKEDINTSLWITYNNSRFLYSIEYPKNWIDGREADAGDGKVLYDEDENDIRIYGTNSPSTFSDLNPPVDMHNLILDNGSQATTLKSKNNKGLIEYIVFEPHDGQQIVYYVTVSEKYFAENKKLIETVAKSLNIHANSTLFKNKMIDKIETVTEPSNTMDNNSYLSIISQGNQIKGPQNMYFQKDTTQNIDYSNLLNNGREQIIVSSGYGPYSSVTYLFDFDGKSIVPLCKVKNNNLNSNVSFSDNPCVFSADKGIDFNDINGDKKDEIIVGNSLYMHACPEIQETTYVWDGDKYSIISEKQIIPESPEDRCPNQPSINPQNITDTGIKLLWPVQGTIIQYPSVNHMAVDIANSSKPPVPAAESGKVTYAGCLKNSYGCHVIIDHSEKYQTLYGHLSSYTVSAGDSVVRGQIIGRMGNTGDTKEMILHFEIRKNGVLLNPLSYMK